ncbi:uncharacterized protein LOC125497863 [Beta vulgaris subsp. vulgaris]|uniref:uncharacterized protein LOC125497863 n=1 Tax=Beta vulgaris subsp. vulgaris TaxID=3555 RepID=UPI0025471DF0|nr:uncharacterized protein LOC125497863 [Beta vulgaris subsp. vulgaris]
MLKFTYGDTIKEGNKATSQNKAKAMIFLRHHLHEGLKIEYLTVKDPQSNLKERYDHQKTVILPKARYDWFHLRLQDFKSTQYREKEFKKYSELISCLLVAEQNNELLMKNHESRPTGSAPFPEANATSHNRKENYQANNSGRGRGHGYGHGRGRGRGYENVRGRGRGASFKNSYSHQRDNKDDNKQEKDKNENVTNVCYRCGGKGHWSHTCRTQKQKGKKVETNLVYEDGEGDFDCGNTTHLEVADFFTTPEGNN